VIIGFMISKTIEYVAISILRTTLLQVATPWYLFAGCIGFSFLIGAVSGILPALQASHTKTADALRYE